MMPAHENARAVAAAPGVGKSQTDSLRREFSTVGSPVDRILAALESAGFRPRRAGKGWRSRCPACEARSASLSICETPNGGVLLHDFAGCDISAVLAAVGLGLADLYPTPLRPTTPEARAQARALALRARVGAAADVLAAEARIIVLAARDITDGKTLAGEDRDRVLLAAERAERARDELRGVR